VSIRASHGDTSDRLRVAGSVCGCARTRRSNLAGFGTTYVMGFIKDATGSFSLALVPLVALAATGAWAIVWISGGQRGVALREGKAATPA